ncbi:MAG: M48 family metallopeptidase, partial [Cyanobacteria bacterium]|nr:M48 family metallopeptidase [Cyanobacteriota bacterium]
AGEFAQRGMGLLGLFVSLVIWGFQVLVAYFQGDAIFLMMSKARQLEHEDYPMLFNVVEEMKIASGLSVMPKIYLIDDLALNAFATGRSPDHASVAITTGLLKSLKRDELQGVIGHEISHVNNRDSLLMTMVGITVGTIVMISDATSRMMQWGGGDSNRLSSSRTSSNDKDNSGGFQVVLLLIGLLLILLGPIFAQLIYFSISRKREYLADACSAQYTRYPEGLASALEKIGSSGVKLQTTNQAMVPLYIANPESGLENLSSTHPPLQERIQILRAMAQGCSLQDYQRAFQQITGKSGSGIPQNDLNQAAPLSQLVPAQILPADELAAVGGAQDSPPNPLGNSVPVEQVRSVNNLLWKKQDYQFIPCSCGSQLKVPKQFSGQNITCPVCKTVHSG